MKFAEMAVVIMRGINQKQIAEQAGVSVTTVSRVINRSGYVKEDVRKKVEEIISKTGYIQVEHSFTQKRRMIGIISTCMELNPYFSRFSLCIQKECEKENYQAVFLQASHITNQVLKDYTKQLAFMGACGIVVCGFEEQSLASDTRRELSECRLPIVFIERTADCYGFDRVLVDSEMGTQMAAKYLLEKGRRHLLYISQSGKTKVENARLEGLHRAVRGWKQESWCQEKFCSSFSPKEASDMVRRALEEDKDITGILAWNDIYAIGAVMAVLEKGRRVPEEIEIIGYDDILAGNLSPALSSVKMPIEEMAASALEIIIMKNTKRQKMVARTVTLEPKLVIRSSR